jgi:hypothetical protein
MFDPATKFRVAPADRERSRLFSRLQPPIASARRRFVRIPARSRSYAQW